MSEARAKQIIEDAKKLACQIKFLFWVTESGITLDGYPFSFQDHQYLVGIYQALSDPLILEIVIRKAAQMGITVMELFYCWWGMRYGRFPNGVLYLLPTVEHAEKVSKTKIQPIINENRLLQSWVSSTDSVTQKSIGRSNFIMSGMNNPRSDTKGPMGLYSYTTDHLVCDEVDHLEDWRNIEIAQMRMSHSKVAWQGKEIKGGTTHLFSVPSMPEYGVDSFFSGKSTDTGGWEIDPSDQRYWFLKCKACNEYTCLEEEFPECIVEVDKKEQKAIRACKKCGAELNINRGEWVAKKPGQKRIGFQISQLFSAYVNPWKLLDQYRKKVNLSTLYNDKLGLPYIESNARLQIAEVLSLCGTERAKTSFPGPCAMGIDQPKEEGQIFHVTIAAKKSDKLTQVIFVGTRTTWADLDGLMREFHVSRCVVDGLPDQNKANDFAGRHRGKIFLNYYAEKQKGGHKWDENRLTVSSDRTESLNASTAVIHDGCVIFPQKSEEMVLFAKHCHNMARKSEEDRDTGAVRQIWKKTGADHYRHSWNYCLMALEEVGIYRDKQNLPPPPPQNLAKSYAVNLDFSKGRERR